MKKIISLLRINGSRKIIFIILLAVFLFSSIMIARRGIDSYKTKNLNKELAKIHQKINSIETTKIENDDDLEAEEKSEKSIIEKISSNVSEEENKAIEIKNQIQELKKINNDIKGWIRIDNTQVSNPIVQTIDNSFYLDHDVGKNESSHGTIFIDVKNDVSNPNKLQGQNIILYGHHMRNGSMFGTLEKYRDSEFFKTNEIIHFDLFPNSYKFQIFGVYLVNEDFEYRNTVLGEQEDINNLLNRLKSKRIQDREITLTPNDTILTLSTCEYDFADARLVVMAKLVSDDEVKGSSQE